MIPLHTAARMALDALEPLSAYGRVGTRDVDQAALQQVCAALRSALAAPMPEPWMPIETAPKDGSELLLSNGETVSQGHWLHVEAYIREKRDADGRYIDQDECDGFDGWIDYSGGMLPEPTHWMPLPAAPGATPPSAPAPGDMVMVPREPTIAMCLAGDGARHNVDDATRSPAVYRAMIAAAP